MRAARVALILGILAAFAPPAPAEELRDFVSPAGGYRIRLPGKPTEKKLDAPEGLLHVAEVEEKNKGVYVVAWTDLGPVAEKALKPQERLKQATHAIVHRLAGKEAKARPITLEGKYPGRKVQATIPRPPGLVLARVYLVDHRLYQLMAIGSTEWASGSRTDEVLKSFALTR